MNKDYTIIEYLRISAEDRNLKSSSKKESNSIASQRLIIQEYVKSREDLCNCRIIELQDDGHSGTNFERPAIKEALELIRQKKAQCMIVKDLSRFGRNYIDVGNYLEQVFPFLGIRFIAINDGYDSSDPACVGSMVTIFKTMFADIYCKDLSQKVKSAQRRLAEQGKYINNYAPYGYIKSPFDSKKLEIDEEAAEIVKWIFKAFLSGKSKPQIAQELNNQMVMTPLLYKEKNGCNHNGYAVSCNETNYWTDNTVYIILRDKRYMGTVVYGKSRRIAIGSPQQVKNPKSQWITVNNMHDGIVSEEVFEKAQALIRELEWDTSTKIKKSLLDSRLKCASCGRTLTLVKSGQRPYYYCQTRRFTTAFSCDKLKLYVEDVKNAVLQSIRLQAEFAVNAEEILLLKYQGRQAELQAKQSEVKLCKAGIDRWIIRQKELFQSYFMEQIAKDFFVAENKLCSAKLEEQGKILKLLQEELKLMQTEAELDNPFVKAIKPYLFIEQLDGDTVAELIDEVRAYDDSTIEICWKFSDDLRILMDMMAES